MSFLKIEKLLSDVFFYYFAQKQVLIPSIALVKFGETRIW